MNLKSNSILKSRVLDKKGFCQVGPEKVDVSIILPVLNGAHCIKQAVESITNQSYKLWELLIIDDGSTDETPLILEEVKRKDDRIRIITNPGHQGIIYSLNNGWKQSEGDLVARMDADDICDHNRIKEQVEYMNSHPEIAVLGTAASIVYGNNENGGVLMMPETHKQIVSQIYRKNPFIHSSVMMRKDFLRKMGGYVLSTGFKNIEDWDLWVRGHKIFKFHNLQKALIKYHARKTVTMRELYNRILGIMRVLIREKRILKDGWFVVAWMVSALLAKANLYVPRSFNTK
ncbi:glycosyltransferase [Candidatus Parcubacteria bacterium]|jgi:glycosyltransferase involved in cell wall biosynthesis|nr:MAG: glycosyltransferase [Candidatus Parcubacteria bacterium]